jgi:hypothetical protein
VSRLHLSAKAAPINNNFKIIIKPTDFFPADKYLSLPKSSSCIAQTTGHDWDKRNRRGDANTLNVIHEPAAIRKILVHLALDYPSRSAKALPASRDKEEKYPGGSNRKLRSRLLGCLPKDARVAMKSEKSILIKAYRFFLPGETFFGLFKAKVEENPHIF